MLSNIKVHTLFSVGKKRKLLKTILKSEYTHVKLQLVTAPSKEIKTRLCPMINSKLTALVHKSFALRTLHHIMYRLKRKVRC